MSQESASIPLIEAGHVVILEHTSRRTIVLEMEANKVDAKIHTISDFTYSVHSRATTCENCAPPLEASEPVQ